jgi:glutathione S-transferase
MSLILHHYGFSNFSEKVRLMFGYKGLAWDSVEIPSHLPKPDYTPLTGGYRRTPSLQIGADVYCDTRLIGEVLEQHCPDPTFYPGARRNRVLAHAIADWAESRLLWPVALYVSGINADRLPEAFHRDRATLHGKPVPDAARVKASAAKYLGQMRSELTAIEDLFADGALYVLGDDPSLADLALYHVPWFFDAFEVQHQFLGDMPLTRQWMDRVGAIGHGQRTELEARDAFEQSNAAIPRAIAATDYVAPEGLHIGDSVMVTPLDEVSPAHGVLAAVDDRRISITVRNERVKEVRVHFPRSGYKLSRARSS